MIIEEFLYNYLSFKGVLYYLVALYLIAFTLCIRAIMNSRSSQGALAWSISLISFPSLAIPFYLLFGRRKFHGYITARRSSSLFNNELGQDIYCSLLKHKTFDAEVVNKYQTFEKLASLNFTSNNNVTLDIDGEKIYKSMLNEINKANDYILIQFYIIRDDKVGELFKSALIAKAKEGVRIYILYDEIGSYDLGRKFISELEHHAIEVVSFISSQGSNSRFQINFRNHRKMIIIDGKVGLLGGANLGEEYNKNIAGDVWRDTNITLEGPAVMGMQVSFIEDWYWSCGNIITTHWEPKPSDVENKKVLILPTGPADELETCQLYFQQAIYSAKKRIWITSPYFVPDSAIIQSLILASLRGVEVKILVPSKSDNILVDYALHSCINECKKTNIQFYNYLPGFLHQKVILIDDDFSSIGTSNLDNRSMKLNFEVSALIVDEEFNKQVFNMLQIDIQNSQEIKLTIYENGSLWFRFKVKLSRLFTPIL